jgi:hypothetical protein
MTDGKIAVLNESILNYYGIDHQLHKLEEELTELLLVVKRVRSGRAGFLSYALIEEIADVENVLDQIKIELQREYISNGDSRFSLKDNLNGIKYEKLEKVITVEGITI